MFSKSLVNLPQKENVGMFCRPQATICQETHGSSALAAQGSCRDTLHFLQQTVISTKCKQQTSKRNRLFSSAFPSSRIPIDDNAAILQRADSEQTTSHLDSFFTMSSTDLLVCITPWCLLCPVTSDQDPRKSSVTGGAALQL